MQEAREIAEAQQEPATTEEAPKPEGSSPEVKRRGRPPKKAETAAEVVEDKEPVGESVEDAPVAVSTEPTPSGANTASSNSAENLPPVTDSELSRFASNVAHNLGGADKVYELAKLYVPEGSQPKPSFIRDNAKRWEFIHAAQEATGGKVKYHG
jgi:hypothetical protein